MPEHRTEAEASNITLSNILLAIFKRKRTILLFTIAGLVAAASVYFLWPPSYESDAVLLVRYVLDRGGVDPDAAAGSGGSLAAKTNDSFINAEVAILKSWDLAVQVAQALGPKRVLPDAKGNPTVNDAAGAIFSGLDVEATKNSNAILVSYSNPRPEVATLVLNEFVNRYFTKHLEVHRSAGAFDFVSQQTDQVRARLNQTEDALKALKAKAGILDLKESTAGLGAGVVRIEDQLRNVEGELAEQRARVKLMEGAVGSASHTAPAIPVLPATSPNAGQQASATATTSSPAPEPTSADTQRYQVLVARLERLRQAELEVLSKYTEGTPQVKSVRSDIEDVEKHKRDLETKFPGLVGVGHSTDFGTERARLAGLEAKRDMLKAELADIQNRVKQFMDTSPQIAGLERNKELEETNYKYFQGSLQKARVDEALDPSKMPNISAVQRPSPPALVTKKRDRIVLGLAGGGFALGVAISLLSELLLNRTFKRRTDVEQLLHSPAMISIPYHRKNGQRMLPWRIGTKSGKHRVNGDHSQLAPWDITHFIRPYAEAIRDRLGLYFELQGITHKPKLVGVAGFGEGSGASTLAAGVAAALSETGDGKVLLVDVNATSGHPFFGGRPATSLSAAIQPQAEIPSAADNLYLATVTKPNNKATQIALKKFFALVPNLKASDFDYIIFDMPPLNQTSPTIGLAALMDKVLLVVEAERNNRELVRRGYRELIGARSDVSIVLNKVRSYLPNCLDEDR